MGKSFIHSISWFAYEFHIYKHLYLHEHVLLFLDDSIEEQQMSGEVPNFKRLVRLHEFILNVILSFKLTLPPV